MIRTLFIALLFSILLFSNVSFGQYQLPFGFEKIYDVAVYDESQSLFKNPWGGGLFAVQFNEIDLDGDGIKDLVVFDRCGSRTLTWKNLGIPGEVSYQFAPELAKILPSFSDWVIFADYNNDGLADIFTYSKGFAGIKVYRNNGLTAEEPFELIEPYYLTSYQGNGYVNILVTYVDYPAIIDIDGDGDLDILTFWGLGSFVELHTNESMELYGVPDSLIFRKTTNCWGWFAESEESNQLYLDTCFILPKQKIKDDIKMLADRAEYRHTGSTFLIFDENDDGLPDLLLGDVDYPAPALLINSGTVGEAVMGSYTFNWPAYDIPIDLLSFPLPALIDLNNSGRKDLVVTTFDPGFIKSQNYENIWYYEDTNTAGAPEFKLKTKSFLQDEMLDFGAGAAPLFFDYNGDGLLDLLIGNFGYLDTSYYDAGLNLNCKYRGQLALLENCGAPTNPQFKLTNRNFADLPSYFPVGERPYSIIPANADLDNDGDMDLLLGNAKGTLIFLENIGSPNQPAQFILKEQNYQNISVGKFSAPQLIDLTGNGLPDLVIGKRNGTISFYQNTGTAEKPVFSFVTDSLGGVDVRNPNLSYYGYCVPHFFKDSIGKTHLFAGSEFGEIFYYTDIDNNLDGQFTLVMKNYLWIDEGLRSTVALANLNNDEYIDMIVGNFSGGLSFFSGTKAPPDGLSKNQLPEINIRLYPNPAKDFIIISIEETATAKFNSVRLLDFMGKELNLNTKSSSAELYLNIEKIPVGVYILLIDVLHHNNILFTKPIKFIKT